MMKLLLTALVVLATWSVNGATRYVDYATGSDANNGTSTATPWKRSPGMVGVTGTAAAFTPAAGDTIVFKGGVTWPKECFILTSGVRQWRISADGTAPSPITYASDPAWFAGGAWTRPLFDFEHTLVGPGWVQAAGVYVTADYITFSGLEFARHRAPRASSSVSTWGSTTICLDNASNFTLTNCVVRDWDLPTSGGTPGVEWNGGGALMRVNNGAGHLVIDCVLHQDAIVQKSGTGVWNIGTLARTIVRNTPQAMMYGQLAYGNTIGPLPDPADLPLAHANAFLCPGTFTCTNNVIFSTAGAAQVIFVNAGFYGAGSVLVANNVVYDVAQPCVAIDTDGLNDAGGRHRIYNNTLVAPGGSGNCVRAIYHANAPAVLPHLDARNNHFITTGDPIGANNPAAGNANVTSLTSTPNVTMTPNAATAAGYTSGNLYAPLDATKATYNAGTSVATYVTTDRLGVARPQAAVYDAGAYEFTPVTGVPGTIVLSAATATIAEDGGFLTVTASRTGGDSGLVGISYATANGDALAGVNYTTASGTLSWAGGDSADKTFAIPILNVPFYGSKSFTATLSAPTGGATLGTPSTQTITINGVGTPPVTTLPGLGPWLATDSDYGPPFTATGTTLSQTIQTLTTNDAGFAIFRFVLATGGNYKAHPTVNAPDSSANSFMVAMNNDAVFDWHINPVTSGDEPRYITTNSTFDTEGVLQTWALPAGTNVLVVFGREANTVLVDLTMELVADEPPVDPPMVVSTSFTTLDGYYKATSNILATITWSTNVTVTGTPRMTNNAGGLFTYTSGSGSDTLTFTYTVAPGDNNQALDYVATSSLALNGGTIRFGAVDAVLTLPAPTTAGSLSFGRSVVIDTTAPVVAIGAPSTILAAAGATINYAVTYYDLNYAYNTLTTSDITLNGTTTGTIATGPNNPYSGVNVTLSGLTVGVGNISLAAGSALDLAGNSAPAAGPSTSFTISSLLGGTANAISTKAGIVISNQIP